MRRAIAVGAIIALVGCASVEIQVNSPDAEMEGPETGAPDKISPWAPEVRVNEPAKSEGDD